MIYVLATWNNKSKGNSKLGDILRKTAGFWATATNALVDISLPHFYAFDILLQTSASQLAMIAVHTPNSIGMAAVQNVADITSITQRPVALDNVAGVIDGSIDVEMHTNLSISQRVDIAANVRTGVNTSTGTSTVAATIDMAHVEISSTVLPAAGFQSAARAARYTKLATSGVTNFLNVYSVYDVIAKRNEKSKAGTFVGQIADNFYLNLTSHLLDALSNTHTLITLSNRSATVAQMTDDMFASLYRNLANRGQISQSAASALSTTGATSKAAYLAQRAGQAAAVIGVIIGSFKAYDGFVMDDGSKAWGNTLMAVGGAVMLAFGATGIGILAGLLIIIAGTLIEIFGAKSDLEEWAAKSFWGSSDDYWGKRRDPDIIKQIEESMGLANKTSKRYSKLYSYFEEEIRNLENIMMGFAIIDGNYRDYKFEISLPRLNESKFSLDVDVELQYTKKPISGSWSDYLGMHSIETVVLSDLTHDIDLERCSVKVNFEDALPQDMSSIEKLTVRVDYKRLAATKFKEFNQEKVIYNRVSDHKNRHKWLVQ